METTEKGQFLMLKRYTFFLYFFVLTSTSCAKSSSNADSEGNTDTGADSLQHTDSNSAFDTGSDSLQNTDPNSAYDTETESSEDAGLDSDFNIGMDTDIDFGDNWVSCLDVDSYTGDDNWQNFVRVDESAVFCGEFKDSRTLEEEFEAKRMVRLIPGIYPVPVRKGTYDFAFPLCFRTDQKAKELSIAGPGSVELTTEKTADGTVFKYVFKQPVSTPNGSQYEVSGYFLFRSRNSSANKPVLLDQNRILPRQASVAPEEIPLNKLYFAINLDKGHSGSFTACHEEFYRNHQRHTVTFEGGEVALDLFMDLTREYDVDSTEPALFTSARGILNGKSFKQDQYFSLIYSPGHHHSPRNFALLFDEPIEEACGLKIIDLDRPPVTVYTVNCDLSEIQQLQVYDDKFENNL